MGVTVLLHVSSTPNFPERRCFHGLSCCKGLVITHLTMWEAPFAFSGPLGVVVCAPMEGALSLAEGRGCPQRPAGAKLFFTISGYELGCRLYFCAV